MSRHLTAAGISLMKHIPAGLIVHGDKDLLQQLLANLLDNVILHAAGANLVRIRAVHTGNRISVEISDNGTGIPLREQGRVFQRFVRLEASRHLPGHGLGLSLAAAIAALHGGSITLRDGHPGLMVVISLGGAQEVPPTLAGG